MEEKEIKYLYVEYLNSKHWIKEQDGNCIKITENSNGTICIDNYKFPYEGDSISCTKEQFEWVFVQTMVKLGFYDCFKILNESVKQIVQQYAKIKQN